MFESAGLLDSGEPDALSLRGRLLKDRALKSAGQQRTSFFDQAEEAYLRAAGDRRATYPLINAATIAFLNGKAERARILAQKTLAILESGEHEPETVYWLGATRAEAELLLGNVAAGKAAIEDAVAGAPAAWEDHAATIRQLQLILSQSGGATNLFDDLRPPASLQFSGLIHLPPDEAPVRELLSAALDEIRPGFAFGALAAGADIVVAELALERGAQLHIVLPAPVELFREISVVPFGEHWTERFDALIDAADAIEAMGGASQLSGAAIALGQEISMGLAIRRARSLASKSVALRLRRAVDGVTGPEALWRRRGLPVHDLTIEQGALPGGGGLAVGTKRALLASARPFPIETELPAGGEIRTAEGAWLLELDDLGRAVGVGVEMLRVAPEQGLGLVYVADEGGNGEESPAEIAGLLARSAPPGAICAAAPGALAIDLCAPEHRFELAGEVVTKFGDIPISLFSLPTAA